MTEPFPVDKGLERLTWFARRLYGLSIALGVSVMVIGAATSDWDLAKVAFRTAGMIALVWTETETISTGADWLKGWAHERIMRGA